MELTVHKESVVGEIQEVELRFCHAQFIFDRKYNRIGSDSHGHAPT